MKNPTLWLIIAMSLVLACGVYLVWDAVHNGTSW